MYPEPKLLIAGEWVSAGGRRTQAVMNPATGAVMGQLPHATTEDLDRALDAAAEVFPKWRAVPAFERGRIMKRAADIVRERAEPIARLATLEMGKPVTEARLEVQRSADIFEWYGEEARRAYGRVLAPRAAGQRLMVVKEPVGPVAAFGPWNFPTGNPGRKLGAAIAAGCPVIMKPAEEAPCAALEVARCLLDAGVPRGVCSIVFGVPAEVSTHLLASKVIRKMSFTGSTPVGKQLAELAARNMIRTTMELGGHAPVLVFGDVDLEHVLDSSAAAKFRNAGQVCVSPTRFYVHETLYTRFVEGLAARAKALQVGDGMVETNRMGPLAHSGRVPFLEPLIEDAVRCGAKVQAGGARRVGPGNFFEPTVLSDVPCSARIMNEEPFGPVAMVNSFRTVEEAISQANRLPYGLAAYAFTNSSRLANRVAGEIESGMVGINSFLVSVPESPFGGVKESGHGSEEGIEGLEACLLTKFVTEA